MTSGQHQAIQRLLRRGMNLDSIMENVEQLQDLRNIEHVPSDVLRDMIKSVAQQSNIHTEAIGLADRTPLQPQPGATTQIPTQLSQLGFSTAVGNLNLVHVNSAVLPQSEGAIIASVRRKAPYHVPRLCFGYNGICTDRTKTEVKYYKSWKTHFKEKHLNSYYNIDAFAWVCPCSMTDRGDGDELMQHIWDDHMLNVFEEASTPKPH